MATVAVSRNPSMRHVLGRLVALRAIAADGSIHQLMVELRFGHVDRRIPVLGMAGDAVLLLEMLVKLRLPRPRGGKRFAQRCRQADLVHLVARNAILMQCALEGFVAL
jgi:hypothetical protein